MLSEGTSNARAAASRANGARSRGPKTPEGKARASQNALKHGLCARKHLLLAVDSRAQFAALETALLDDLCPEGALQTLLAHRLIAAAWRLQRADRLEFELFGAQDAILHGLGRALIRDGRDARVFPTLVRYRNATQAEFFRTLKVLKGLQTEAARKNVADEVEVEQTPRLTVVPPPAQKGFTLCTHVDDSDPKATRNEPERRSSGHEGDTPTTQNEPEARPSDHEGRQATPNGARLHIEAMGRGHETNPSGARAVIPGSPRTATNGTGHGRDTKPVRQWPNCGEGGDE